MVMKQPFTTASPMIVSYDYTDIERGLGIETYYLARTETVSAVGYLLLDQVLPSSGTIGLSGGSASIDFDLDYFKIPKTAKGTAVFSADIYVSVDTMDVKVTIKKVDGVTAAVTTVGAQVASPAYAGNNLVLLQIPLTETHFSQGDILRASVDVGGNNTNQQMGIDPAGLQTNGLGHTFNPAKLNIPFKIDL